MTPEETEIKGLFIQRFGITCWGCTDPVSAPKQLVLDHIIPRRDGGPDTIENRALLCYDCNHEKGSRFTLGGLRDLNKVKTHTIDLKGALAWTREQAKTSVKREQLPLPSSNQGHQGVEGEVVDFLKDVLVKTGSSMDRIATAALWQEARKASGDTIENRAFGMTKNMWTRTVRRVFTVPPPKRARIAKGELTDAWVGLRWANVQEHQIQSEP